MLAPGCGTPLHHIGVLGQGEKNFGTGNDFAFGGQLFGAGHVVECPAGQDIDELNGGITHDEAAGRPSRYSHLDRQ